MDGDVIVFDLARLIMHPYFAFSRFPPPRIGSATVHDTVLVTLPSPLAGVVLGRPFQLQAIVREVARPQMDRLADDDRRGVRFVVERPSFPHCFADGPGRPGDTVSVRYERLVSDKPIHALLGADLVFKGLADAQGGGSLDLPIPVDAKAGLHLITIGTDGTALKADCVVDVLAEPTDDGGRLTPVQINLIKSHEDLLKAQQKLLSGLGVMLREVLATRNLSNPEALGLLRDYQGLVRQQADMVGRFERLLRETIR